MSTETFIKKKKKKKRDRHLGETSDGKENDTSCTVKVELDEDNDEVYDKGTVNSTEELSELPRKKKKKRKHSEKEDDVVSMEIEAHTPKKKKRKHKVSDVDITIKEEIDSEEETVFKSPSCSPKKLVDNPITAYKKSISHKMKRKQFEIANGNNISDTSSSTDGILEINSQICYLNTKKKKRKLGEKEEIVSKPEKIDNTSKSTSDDEKLELASLDVSSLNISDEETNNDKLHKRKKKKKSKKSVSEESNELSSLNKDSLIHSVEEVGEVEEVEESRDEIVNSKKSKKKKSRNQSISNEINDNSDFSSLTPRMSLDDMINAKLANATIESDDEYKPLVVKVEKTEKIKGKKKRVKKGMTEDDIADEIDLKTTILDSLTQDEIATFQNLYVSFNFEVPPSHCIETRISFLPTNQQLEQFALLDVEMKKGAYSEKEDKIIKNNFKNFCQTHNIPEDPNPFLAYVVDENSVPLLSRAERLKFVRYLGRDLENRYLYSIYKRFKVLNSNTVKGRFTKSEDDIILSYVEKLKKSYKTDTFTYSKPFKALATILNRDNLAIEKHYIQLTRQVGTGMDKSRIDELISQLLEVLNKSEVTDLKDAEIRLDHWKELEKRLNVCYVHIKGFWLFNVYPKLFAEERLVPFKVREQIAELLIEKRETDWRCIDWKEIATHFNNQTSHFVYSMFRTLVYRHVPPDIKENVYKSAKYLKKNYFGVSNQKYRYKLDTLDLVNGEYSFMKTDKES